MFIDTTMKNVITIVREDLQKPEAYLFPLRLFIGLGWLRVAAEKMINPDWFTGDALTVFLTEQMATGHIHFGLYTDIINQVFLPHVEILSWIILIGQLLVGLAIVTGTLTNAAIIGGIFMNLNFVLAGAVNPSAFYIVIQMALFAGNAGAIIGVDKWLMSKRALILVSARKEYNPTQFERIFFFSLGFVALAGMIISFPMIQDFSPHGVDDPALLLLILFGLGGITTLSLSLRQNTIAQ